MTRLVSGFLLVLLLLTSAVSAQESTSTPTPNANGYVQYTVVLGDTLGSIAARYGTTTLAILRANPLSNPNVIYAGTVLNIPSNATRTPSATGSAATVAAPSATETPAPTASPTQQAATETPAPTETATATPTEQPATAVPTQQLTTEAQTPLAPATAVPSIGFELGGEIFSLDHLSTLQSAGMTWAEVQLYWVVGETTDNARHFIEQAHQSGLKILLQISGSPNELGSGADQYIASFATYLGSVAALAPDAIQVWGDMNVPSGWTPGKIDPTTYSQMLTAAFAAIKRANPPTLVISGALVQTAEFGGCSANGCDEVPYLNEMALAGVGQAADCIGIRYTLGAVAPDATSGDPRGDQPFYYYPTLVSTYASIFPTKPLCFTEIGYLVTATPVSGFEWAQNTTADQRAEWLARAALLARLSGRIRLLIVDNVDASGDNPQVGYAILGADQNCLACLTLSTVMRQ